MMMFENMSPDVKMYHLHNSEALREFPGIA
jgi:hypothetical protein